MANVTRTERALESTSNGSKGGTPINEWMLKNLTKHSIDVEQPDRGGYRPVPFWDYNHDHLKELDEE